MITEKQIIDDAKKLCEIEIGKISGIASFKQYNDLLIKIQIWEKTNKKAFAEQK